MKSLITLVLLLVFKSELSSAQSLTATPLFPVEGTTVQACVNYSPLPDSTTIIVLSTESGDAGGAISGEDFVPIVESLSFGPDSSSEEQCRDIQINIDAALEPFQAFRIRAVLDSVDIMGSPQSPFIQSQNLLMVGFNQNSYSFDEDQATGKQACIVIEVGSIEGNLPLTFTVSFSDGTALESDGDYNPNLLSALTIQLNADTPPTGACFEVPISTDSTVETDEMFTMSINSNTQVEFSATNGEATVTIVNDDASCTAPPALAQGSFTLSGGGSSPSSSGDTATYTCDPDYTLMGESTLTCVPGDVWNPAAPGTCGAVRCDPLSPPGNGQVMQVTVTFMSIATYSCNPGYGLSGNSTRTCQADQTWSGSEPTCTELIACPMLSAPEDGSVSPMEGFEGDDAVYDCESGYALLGNEIRTCQAGGQWSGVAPTCVETEVIPPSGGLTQQQTVGVGVGVGIAGAVILILVIVAIIVLVLYMKRRKADKYVLNYSTVYGNQRKNEMASRPLEPAEENTYQEGGNSAVPQEAEDSLGKEDPPES